MCKKLLNSYNAYSSKVTAKNVWDVIWGGHSVHWGEYALSLIHYYIISCLILQAKKKNEPKSLEDYLNDVSENPVHKLEVSWWNIWLFFPNTNFFIVIQICNLVPLVHISRKLFIPVFSCTCRSFDLDGEFVDEKGVCTMGAANVIRRSECKSS